jgi:hypothetical protein
LAGVATADGQAENDVRELLMGGPRLSRGVVRLVTCASVVLYGLVFAKAGALLPEFIFRDADKIQAQMSGSSTYEGSSFDAVASFYRMFGPTLLNLLIVATGALFMRAMLCRANRFGLCAAALLLCLPCVFFNLFVASKDTLVVMMSLAIFWAARSRRAWLAPCVALLLYSAFALLVRPYFLLIVVLAAGALLFQQLSMRWRVVLIVALAGSVAFAPASVYFALLHPRDMAVDYLVYQSPFGARTSFYNPLPPLSWVAFVYDYLYATARLNLALLFSPGAKELAMQLFVVLAVWPALRSLGSRARLPFAYRLCACVVFAHVCVSMLFEPDLGSYIRHLSSIALFSMALLHEWCTGDAARARSMRDADRDAAAAVPADRAPRRRGGHGR